MGAVGAFTRRLSVYFRGLKEEILEKILDAIIQSAIGGNMTAAKMIADRLDAIEEPTPPALTDTERIERINRLLERAAKRRTRLTAR